jgi:hypothetical protein
MFEFNHRRPYTRKNLTSQMCSQDVFARCVRNTLVANLSTSSKNAVILSSCYKLITTCFHVVKLQNDNVLLELATSLLSQQQLRGTSSVNTSR